MSLLRTRGIGADVGGDRGGQAPVAGPALPETAQGARHVSGLGCRQRAGSSCRTRPCSAPRSGPTASGSTRARIGASSHCTGYRPTGALPAELANLMNLSRFSFNGDDGLCAPNDASFQTWLDGIDNVVGPDCTPSPWGAHSVSAASRRWCGPILEFDAAAPPPVRRPVPHTSTVDTARHGRLFAPDHLAKWNYFTTTYSRQFIRLQD